MIDHTNGIYICDYCEGLAARSGEFNTETGNHSQCDTIATLRARVQACAALPEQLLEWAECVSDNNGEGEAFSVSLASVAMEMRDKAAALKAVQENDKGA